MENNLGGVAYARPPVRRGRTPVSTHGSMGKHNMLNYVQVSQLKDDGQVMHASLVHTFSRSQSKSFDHSTKRP